MIRLVLAEITRFDAHVDWGARLASLEFWSAVVHAAFLLAFGACVGSFLNVVVYRLPARQSVVTPPSRCPLCGHRLSWRENLPIVAWLFLRGRCAACRARISIQYPLIELAIGVLFAGFFLLYFVVPADSWAAAIADPWWRAQGFWNAIPMFMSIVFLLAGLIAMSLIDARTFTIPIELTRAVTFIAFATAIIQPFMPTGHRAVGLWPVELPGWMGCAVGLGGLAGTLIAWLQLARGRLEPSFADYDLHVKPEDPLSSYPFARREMRKEVAYLLPIVVGLGLGWLVGQIAPSGPDSAPPLWMRSLAATSIGFLVGGGMLWAIRVLATWWLDREALGLGDVHLLAAVGAVLGWRDAVWTLALAPVFALSWVGLRVIVGKMLRRRWMEIPLGPFLAIGAFVRILSRPFLDRAFLAFAAWETRVIEAGLQWLDAWWNGPLGK